jgi:hypothetical protein
MKELDGKFDVKSTDDPLFLLEEILQYIQRVQKSDGTLFDPTRASNKKKTKSKFKIQHEINYVNNPNSYKRYNNSPIDSGVFKRNKIFN